MKITTKHVSNGPVTFVTQEHFAVLLFLPSCWVNSLLSAKTFPVLFIVGEGGVWPLVFYQSPFDCMTSNFMYLYFFTLRFSFSWRNDTIVFVKLTRTLRSEDGDGRENVAEKVNSRPFNLRRDYSKSLTLSNVGEPS